MTPPEQSDTLRDLQLALHAATSLQATIRHADAKAQLLLGFQGGLAVIVTEKGLAIGSDTPRALLSIALLVAIAWLGGLAVGGRQLLAVIAPRLTKAHEGNRFAFPAARPKTERIRDQRNEAWDQVAALAAIAVAKHSLVRQALPALTVSCVSGGLLLILDMIIRNAA